MQHPFIIWTFRRTGGTSLTDFLMDVSDFPRAQHEPFNWDREYGGITKHFSQTKDVQKLRSSLQEIVEQGVLVKHCIELVSPEFNAELLRAFSSTGTYRHLLLFRRDESSRLLSLFTAMQTNVWGKHNADWTYSKVASGETKLSPIDLTKVEKEWRNCWRSRRAVLSQLQEAGAPLREVYFEDLYTGEPAARVEQAKELLAWLGLEDKASEEQLNRCLFETSQDTRRVLDFIPNKDEVISLVRRLQQNAPGAAA